MSDICVLVVEYPSTPGVVFDQIVVIRVVITPETGLPKAQFDEIGAV